MDDSDGDDNENEDRNDNVAADTKEEVEVVVVQNGRYWEVVETLQLVLLFLFHCSVCGDVWMMVVHHHVVQLMEKPYPDCRHCYYALYESRHRVVVMDLAVLHVPATLDQCRQASLICFPVDDPLTYSYRPSPQHSMVRQMCHCLKD